MNITMLTAEELSKDESLSLSVSQMVSHICSRVDQLDVSRRYMFMQWLMIHSRTVRSFREVRENLNVWLGSLPPESAEWEYKLIMGETTWWRELDERRLERIMLDCLGHNP